MGTRALTGQVVALGRHRVSVGASNFQFQPMRTEHDVSAFDDETASGLGGLAHSYIKGARNDEASVAGRHGYARDFGLLNELAADGSFLPMVSYAVGANIGDLAFMERCQVMAAGDISGEFDSVVTLQRRLRPYAAIELGSLLYPGVGGALGTTWEITATGGKAAVNVGALGAGQELVACAIAPDVPAPSGSLTLALESDTANTFAGGETVRHTFAALTAAGEESVIIDGDTTPITDTWWRINATAASGSWYPIVAMFIRTKL